MDSSIHKEEMKKDIAKIEEDAKASTERGAATGEDDTAVIPFEWIADAKLVMTDALVEASLKARGPIEGEDGQADE